MLNLKVYVSSTSVDLKDYRSAVITALRKMGMQPVCMEDYVAQDKLPVDKCLSDVSQCDVYVGIFAWRYGFIPPGYDKSITELEYRKAAEKGLEKLIFLLDENAKWPAEHCDTRADAKRINDLRDELKLGGMMVWFTPSPHHLASEVQSAVHRHVSDRMERFLADRYAEVSVASTPDKEAAVRQAMELLQESLRQQAIRAQQTQRDPIPINLPKLRGTFVDREIERDTLYHCLRADERKLVVVVAPGGYGKTELTTKVLKEIAPGNTIASEDIHGILYLKCVRAEVSLGQIFAEAGRIVGKKDEFREVYASKETPLARKLEFFFREISKAGNVLIVMDNFEDLLEPSDDSIQDNELREFLETAAAVEHTVRLIVTSRAVPKFKGSRKIEKIDLSAGLPEDQAIRYLREEGSEYGLDKEDEEVLRAFVRRVHGIPKALESVIGYLEDHYPAVGFKDLLANKAFFEDFDRHDFEKGLKSLIFQQFKNQPPDAQLVLSALSIFPKPVPQAALRYLLQGIGTVEFASLLTRLEKNRLIIQSGGSYDLHPIVRSFVYDRIPVAEPPSEHGKSKDNEISLFIRPSLHKQAAEFYRKLRKPEKEWKNINDLEPQLQEIHHLIFASVYDAAIALLEAIEEKYLVPWGYYELIVEIRKRLIDKLNDPFLNAKNYGSLGDAYSTLSRFKSAIDFFTHALSFSIDADDKPSQAKWLSYMGLNHHYLGNYHTSIELQEKALILSREINDMYSEAHALNNIGYSQRSIAHYEDSIISHKRALEIYNKIGCAIDKAICLNYLGEASRHIGDYANALNYFQEAFTIAEKQGHRRLKCSCLNKLGTILSVYGDHIQAMDYFTQAMKIARDIGELREEGIQVGYIGDILTELGDYDQAIAYYHKALKIVSGIKAVVWEGRFLSGLGNVYVATSQYKKAEDALLLSKKLVTQIQNKNRQLYTATKLAELYVLTHKIDKAAIVTRDACEWKAMGFYHRALVLQSIIAARLGSYTNSFRFIEEILIKTTEMNRISPQFYPAYYSRGLSFAILYLISEGTDMDAFKKSRESYTAAFKHCRSKGVKEDSARLLDTIKPLDKSNNLSELFDMINVLFNRSGND